MSRKNCPVPGRSYRSQPVYSIRLRMPSERIAVRFAKCIEKHFSDALTCCDGCDVIFDCDDLITFAEVTRVAKSNGYTVCY